MITAFYILLGITGSLVFYTFIGYPALLLFFKKFFSNQKNHKNHSEKINFISHVIAAYNEENVIKEKINNLIKIKHPVDYEVVIVSDGSTDKTEEIVSSFKNSRIKIFRQGRSGKTSAQNLGVEKAKGNVIIFSDANTILDKEAVVKLCEKLEEGYALVGGNVQYASDISNPESFYYRIESYIKKLQGELGSLIGAHGGLYATWKSLYIPLERDDISDLLEPLFLLHKGYRIGFCEKALGYEPPLSPEIKKMIKRRRRIVAQALNSIIKIIKNKKFNPWLLFHLFSYKILRYIVGLNFLVFTISYFALCIYFPYLLIIPLILLILFLLLLLIPFLRGKLISLSKLFLVFIISSILGIMDIVKNRKYTEWIPRSN